MNKQFRIKQIKKPFRKKSQMALFMIIGLLILGGVLFLVFAVSHAESGTMRVQKEQIHDLFVKKGKYAAFAESCLEQSLTKGLQLIAMQGGAIYNDQMVNGRETTNHDFYSYTHVGVQGTGPLRRIHIGLKVLSSVQSTSADVYPFGQDNSQNSLQSAQLTTTLPLFGAKKLIPLCDSFGLNMPDPSVALQSCGDFRGAYDNRLDISDHDSIQEYLQEFIAQDIVACLNLDVLPEFSDYTVIQDSFMANVVFGETDITSNISFEVEKQQDSDNTQQVQPQNGQQQTKRTTIDSIFAVHNVRLKQVYELLSHIINADATDLFFNKELDAGNTDKVGECKSAGYTISCLKPGMVVKGQDIKDASGAIIPDYDLLTITDTQSILDGKPYLFQTVIENRRPALDYIAPVSEGGDGSFSVTLLAYDPDEDNYENGAMADYYFVEGNDNCVFSGRSDKKLICETPSEVTVFVCDNDKSPSQDNSKHCDSQNIEIAEGNQ